MSKVTYVVDPAHTLVEFSVKHMMISTVKGRFSGVEGIIQADPADLTSAEFNIAVDVATVDTREAQRDGHLRSADFFDTENHPKLTFKSKKVTGKGGDEYAVTGDLTIRGTTREVTLNLSYEGANKDPWGNDRVGFLATGKVNRKDFGLLWNVALEAGGWLVGEEVKMEVHLEAIKQAGSAVA